MRVPFVPTPFSVALKMLELADVRPGEVVVDAGAGDCRVVIAAIKYFNAIGVGVEINEGLVRRCIMEFKRCGVEGRALVVLCDVLDFDYSIADVVVLYLGPELNERLRPKLEREMRPGARIVSHDFEVPGWRPVKVAVTRGPVRDHKLFLYKL